jgi:sortase A
MALKRKLISNILIAVGILLIVVPLVITYMNKQRNDDLIDEFLKQSEMAVSETDDLVSEEVESFYIPEAAAASEDVPEPGTAAEPGSTPDPAANTPSAASTEPSATPKSNKKPLMSKDEIKKRMTGVLIIDKINLRMLIMDGVDNETLRVAAGRMPDTGKLDEIGNCVLAGHRNYTFGKYFNRLDELEAGDKIIVQTSTKTLHYEVYKKFIVEPTDFSITAGNDKDKILTLFTCHPVAVATHRLVVQAKQTD